jgi:hypothetical protein
MCSRIIQIKNFFSTEIQNRVDPSSEDLRVRLDKRRHHVDVDVSDVNRNESKRHEDRHTVTSSKSEAHRTSRHEVRAESPPVKIINIEEKKKDSLVS